VTVGTEAVVTALLQEHGRTYAAEADIALSEANASGVFRLLCLSLLLSARIRSEVAVRAAIALADHGWTTADAMAASTWEDRTAVLKRAGYTRYDEKTARMLGSAAQRVLEVDGGDLDHLRQRAGYDPARERALLQEFTGIGPLGASIFAREAQVAWPELYPYADDRALRTAQRLGLPAAAEDLAGLVPEAVAFTRLVAGLVRCRLAKGEDAILALASAEKRTT
jgi:endonuclease III